MSNSVLQTAKMLRRKAKFAKQAVIASVLQDASCSWRLPKNGAKTGHIQPKTGRRRQNTVPAPEGQA